MMAADVGDGTPFLCHYVTGNHVQVAQHVNKSRFQVVTFWLLRKHKKVHVIIIIT